MCHVKIESVGGLGIKGEREREGGERKKRKEGGREEKKIESLSRVSRW